MSFVSPVSRPVDVLINSDGPWSVVRTEQPFLALQQQGWDVRLHKLPFELVKDVRPGALVVWQRPIANSMERWLQGIQLLRRKGCLVIVEWDDHPDLFPESIQQRFRATDLFHLRCCHAIQTSSSRLAEVLRAFHPYVFTVENAVNPIPPCRQRELDSRPRLFLGNFNRETEQAQLAGSLRSWMLEPHGPELVMIGRTGLEGQLPADRLECHPPLAYEDYRTLMASCTVALIPLLQGVPQSCKTPIKWMEAAAESVAVVAGPELYGPWMEHGRYGLYASRLDQMVPLARQLVSDEDFRAKLVLRAHQRAGQLQLQRQLPWRMELYRHLIRLENQLEAMFLQRFPESFG